MKKFVLICAVAAIVIIYSILHNQSGNVVVSNSSNSSSGNTTVVTGSTQSSSTYKDGMYTGAAADAFYGAIQVQATITGGKITDVQFLQYPNDRDDSIRINQSAMPQLQQEAIQAQSAHVDIVSGATDSSQAFMQSLASALSQAKS